MTRIENLAILLQDDKALMREIFSKWGLEMEDAQAVADALGDWVDEDNNVALNGAEEEEYLKAANQRAQELDRAQGQEGRHRRP